MANISDYLDWRGDLDFSVSPFCEVDNLILSELEACISTSDHVEGIIDELAVVEAINSFLSGLTKMNRAIFVRR